MKTKFLSMKNKDDHDREIMELRISKYLFECVKARFTGASEQDLSDCTQYLLTFYMGMVDFMKLSSVLNRNSARFITNKVTGAINTS